MLHFIEAVRIKILYKSMVGSSTLDRWHKRQNSVLFQLAQVVIALQQIERFKHNTRIMLRAIQLIIFSDIRKMSSENSQTHQKIHFSSIKSFFASHMNFGWSAFQSSTPQHVFSQTSPSKCPSTNPWMVGCRLSHTRSYYVSRMQKHPLSAHVIHLSLPIFS